ncbi:MAG: DUF2235 domain-containing protein, partial [Chloroflexota bacterium]
RDPIDVTFLGVWDTVGAFGIPIKVLGLPLHTWDLFTDLTVSPNVKKAVHIVSIDETRQPFEPVLMNEKPGIIHEIWFPGVHSDVGGSYEEDYLGKLSLTYMVNQLDRYITENDLPKVIYNQEELEKHTLDPYLPAPEDAPLQKRCPVFHFHGLGGFSGLGTKKQVRQICVLKDGKMDKAAQPLIHQSAFDLRESRHTYGMTKGSGWLKKLLPELIRIQYNPPGIKLAKPYQIEEAHRDIY